MRRFLPIPGNRRVVFSACALLASCLPIVLSCDREATGRPAPPQEKNDPTPLRSVRVWLIKEVQGLRIRVEGDLAEASSISGLAAELASGKTVSVMPHRPGYVRAGNTVVPQAECGIELAGEGRVWISYRDQGKWSEPHAYPGSFRVSANSENTLDVQNLVDVEDYVACVTAAEIWPTFHDVAFQTQAIIARTYVLYQMERRLSASYDIRASDGAQVYRGFRDDGTGRRARKATVDTRGLVCSWRSGDQDVLFSTYYSAVCGGTSQSAAIFSKTDDIPPLQGGVACDYCQLAPKESYRWGPFQISRRDAFARLTARYPALSSLGTITDITVLQRTGDNRPIRLTIAGSSGQKHEMLAEHFRLAMGSNKVRSTHFRVRVDGRQVIISDGRGFGHGLGLCQWGMQGQAVAGRSVSEILGFYFPTSKLTRAY